MKKLLLIILTFAVSNSFAQSNYTLYNMTSIPQRLSINPAKKPDCKWYIGTPALSSTGLEFTSNAIDIKKFNTALVPNADDSSNYTLNINELSSILSKNSYIGLNVNEEWINLGFRLGKNMFFANVTEKVKTRVNLPGDFFKFVFEGNGNDNLGYDFNFNFGVDVLHMREYAVGYNRTLLGDRLTVGGKLKYMQGMNIINTVKSDLIFSTDPESFKYTLEADIEVNASSPLLGKFDEAQILDYALGSLRNVGWGIDLGASLDVTKRLNISASVVDIGQIIWSDNVINYKSKNPGAKFEFRGLDAKDFFSDSVDYAESFSELGDSVLTIFDLDSSNNDFATGLMGEFYLGANYSILENHSAGILLYGSFYNQQLFPAATLSWNSNFRRILSVSVSYTMMRGNFANAGLGLGLNLGPEQFYFVSDNLIGAGNGNYKNIGIKFGWNHVFGRRKVDKKDKKARKDK